MIVRTLASFAVLASFQPALAETFLPDFETARFVPGAAIDNWYLPLIPRSRSILAASGEDDEGEAYTERTDRRVVEGGPEIMGVRATTLLDASYEDGLLVEETFDYFAQDVAGNVWYLGEDVTNFHYDDDGILISTDDESAWRAGVNGAKPGWIMPAAVDPGVEYYQEYAPKDEALDRGLTHSILDSLTIGSATWSNVLQVLETSELSPDDREFKYYAPGFGLIRVEEGLDLALANPELTFDLVAPVPLPAPLLLLCAGAALLAGASRKQPRSG